MSFLPINLFLLRYIFLKIYEGYGPEILGTVKWGITTVDKGNFSCI